MKNSILAHEDWCKMATQQDESFLSQSALPRIVEWFVFVKAIRGRYQPRLSVHLI